MAEEKESKKAKYGPTPLAKASPRYLLTRQIGIGGDVTVKGKVFKEATPEQYEEIFMAKTLSKRLVDKIA